MANIKWENGKYVLEVNGTLEYDERDIAKVQEKFNIDMAFYFAEAIQRACLYNGLVENEMNKKVAKKNIDEKIKELIKNNNGEAMHTLKLINLYLDLEELSHSDEKVKGR